jgi:hypothetical protein
MACRMEALLVAAIVTGGSTCRIRGTSAFRVGELPSMLSIIIGTTGASVYLRDRDGERAQDGVGNRLWDLCCFSLWGLIEIGKRQGFLHFSALPS